MIGATDHLRPEDTSELTDRDLAATAGLTESEVRELREYRLLEGDDMRTALALREAARLRKDFDLDLFSTGLLARCIRRTHLLESQLQHERAHAGAHAHAVYTEVTYAAVEVRGR